MNNSIDDMGNVLNNNQTENLIYKVINYVADTVRGTFGPYGHNTLIQGVDTVTSTKDGWTVLQNIVFKDPTLNAIKSMIANVAQSTVLLVGDGSTTSTIAAKYLNENVTSLKSKYTIRELEDSLTYCTNKIIKQLKEDAYDITDENLRESIYKIALVSTNWNEELSNMIADIYVNTHNPIIKIDNSGTDKTYVEYINGFDLAGSLVAGGYYINNRDKNTCDINNPYILIFDHNIQEKYFISLFYLSEICRTTRRTLVLIAPGFDNGFITRYNASNMECLNRRSPIINMVLVKVVNYYTIDRECIDDFAILTSSKIVSMTDTDFNDFLDEIVKTMGKNVPTDSEDYDEVKAERAKFISTVASYINQTFGSCEKISIGEKSLLIQGMTRANIPVVEDRKESIQCEIDKKTREYDALCMLTDDIRMKRIRLGKLQCHMAVIKVGGYGAANIKAKTDALEDATRACEAAYRDGYTIGGSMATIIAADNVRCECEDDSLNHHVADCIYNAFVGVFYQLVINKFGTEDIDYKQINDTINHCIDNYVTYDIINDKYDNENNVINPVNTDIEVLKACLRLVLICITSNQFIYKQYSTDTGDFKLTEVN